MLDQIRNKFLRWANSSNYYTRNPNIFRDSNYFVIRYIIPYLRLRWRKYISYLL